MNVLPGNGLSIDYVSQTMLTAVTNAETTLRATIQAQAASQTQTPSDLLVLQKQIQEGNDHATAEHGREGTRRCGEIGDPEIGLSVPAPRGAAAAEGIAPVGQGDSPDDSFSCGQRSSRPAWPSHAAKFLSEPWWSRRARSSAAGTIIPLVVTIPLRTRRYKPCATPVCCWAITVYRVVISTSPSSPA